MLNFDQLQAKIDTIQPRANYQYVVICHLLRSRALRDDKHEIALSLLKNNKAINKELSHFETRIPVWGVLSKNGVIRINGDSVQLLAEITADQRVALSKLCQKHFKISVEIHNQFV